jgi:hypothetical protein
MTKPHHWEGKCGNGHAVKVVVEEERGSEAGSEALTVDVSRGK